MNKNRLRSFEIKEDIVAQGTCEEGTPVRQGAVYLFTQPIILRVGDFVKITRRKGKCLKNGQNVNVVTHSA